MTVLKEKSLQKFSQVSFASPWLSLNYCQHGSMFALVTIGVAGIGSVTFIFCGSTLKWHCLAVPAWLARLTQKKHSQCMFCGGIPVPSVQDL